MLKSIFTHSTALNVISKLKSDTKGSIAPMFAISATMLVMGLACAVDMSSAFHSKSRLQDITDSISLSAAKSGIEGQGELMTLANNYLASHYSADELATVTINSIVRSEDTVTVNATNIVDTNFAQIFGQDNLNVTTESSSTISQSAIDLAFVLDTTGSMSGSKINTLKVAANDLVDVFDELNSDKIRVSVVPFANYVNVGIANEAAPWLDVDSGAWNGCVGSRTGNSGQRAEYAGREIRGISGINCGTELQPLTHNMAEVKSTITSLNARGWTYLPAGLMWGWRTLTPEAPFTQAASSTTSSTDRIMVVMTDGANTRSQGGSLGAEGHETPNGNGADDLTEDLCANIKDDNILVYSIAYEITNTATRNRLEDCASNPSMYFDASNGAELREAFTQIGISVTNLRISS